MNERRTFIHAILEQPDDYGLRLIYADWLDEHEGMEECWYCTGRGYTATPGAMAEAKRLILSGHRVDFTNQANLLICPRCNGQQQTPNLYAALAQDIREQVVRSCTCHDKRATEFSCYSCRLLGLDHWQSWGLSTAVPRPLSWYSADRGFVIAMTLLLKNFLQWAGVIFFEQPIAQVRLPDVAPRLVLGQPFEWIDDLDSEQLATYSITNPGPRLPKGLFLCLKKAPVSFHEVIDHYPSRLWYKTDIEAFSAINFATILYGRLQANKIDARLFENLIDKVVP